MKIIVHTKTPRKLVDRINNKITKNEIRTWEIKDTTTGFVYNHTPEQWNDKALIKPDIHDNNLLLEIVWWESVYEPGDDIKGYIIGRFTELLMVHCSDSFDYLEVRYS